MKGLALRRRNRGGCLVKLLVLATFFAAAFALAWMLFLPVVLTQQLRSRTGFDAEVTNFAVNPVTGHVVLRGLVLSNPAAFGMKDGLQLRTFEADADVSSYFGDKLIFDDLTIDVQRLTLVKRADGRTNLEFFQHGLVGMMPGPPSAKSGMLVRRLHLRFDTLGLADRSNAQGLRVREYQLGLDQTFTNISELRQLLGPDVLRTLLANDLLNGLAPFLSGDFGRTLTETARAAGSAPPPAGSKATDLFRGFLDKLEEKRKP